MFTLIEKAREFLIELYIYIYISISGCLLLYSHFIYSIRSETVLKRSWGHLVASLSDFYETPNNVHWRVERDCIAFGSSSVSKQSFTKEKESCLRAFYYYSIMTIFAIEKMTRKYIFFNQKWQSSSLFEEKIRCMWKLHIYAIVCTNLGV